MPKKSICFVAGPMRARHRTSEYGSSPASPAPRIWSFSGTFLMAMSIALSCVFVLPLSASAATLYFDPQDRTVGTEMPFKVAALIDSAEPVNAFDIAVAIPKGLTVLGTDDGSSIINYWVEAPRFDDGSRLLHFAGIVPGGFRGSGARLVTITLRADSVGTARIAIDPSSSVLRNDERASKEPLSLRALVLRVEPGRENIDNAIPDTEPPLPFTPVIASDPLIAGGTPVVIFATQDGNSGVARYEVAESQSRSPDANEWVPAESPYVLHDTSLASWISVRAIDSAGNIRMEVIPPSRFDAFSVLLHRTFALFVLACLILVLYAAHRPRVLRVVRF